MNATFYTGAALVAAGLALLGVAALNTMSRPAGRHRAPDDEPEPEHAEEEHEGATEAYADDLAALRAAATASTVEIPTIAEVSADAEVIVDKQHRAEEAEEARLLAEVRAEMDAVWAAVEDAVIRDRMATAAALARWARRPVPTYDRSAARERTLVDLFEEVTGPIDVRGLRALVGAA